MLDLEKNINDLFLAHKAFLVNIKSLVSLIDIAYSVFSKTLTDVEVESVYKSLRNLGTSFINIKDVLINHENMDYAVLQKLVNKREMDDIRNDHIIIENAVTEMQNEIYQLNNWNVKEIKEHTKSLQQKLWDYQSLITSHVAKENKFLERGVVNQKG